MLVTDVVAVHVADQHCVDLAQARIVRSGYRATGVVKQAGAVRILEDQGAVELAKLAFLTAEWRDFYVCSLNRLAGQRSCRQCRGEAADQFT